MAAYQQQKLDKRGVLFVGSNRTLPALPARFSSGEALQQLSYQSEEDLGAALQQATFHLHTHYVLVVDLWLIRAGDDSDLKDFFSQVPLSQGSPFLPTCFIQACAKIPFPFLPPPCWHPPH